MPSSTPVILVLGTGGTIAGLAESPAESSRYQAAQLPISTLAASLPTLEGHRIEAQQVLQIDSKDLNFGHWLALLDAIRAAMLRSDVAAIVITHGTDTLEETAYFLHRVLAPSKPIVLTAAMRPANAPDADGPRNLADALAVASSAPAPAILVCMAGQVYGASSLRKAHTMAVDAFTSDDGPLLGRVEAGRLEALGIWPAQTAPASASLPSAGAWPWVEIVQNHVHADGRAVAALVQAGVQGLVVAGTGNGTLSEPLDAALRGAVMAGVRVVRASRCLVGAVSAEPGLLPVASATSPVKARIDLLLELLAAQIDPA